MLRVVKPGLQSTLQGAPRLGGRQYGVPYAGPADPVSMALANRLVGNALDTTALEISYGGFEADIEASCSLAITGAFGGCMIDGASAPAHETLAVNAGVKIVILPPETGARTYLAIHSGFQASVQFGSTSTYMPAGLGGYEGRALQPGDQLQPNGPAIALKTVPTPLEFRPVYTDAFALRACLSAESEFLEQADLDALFETDFRVGRQATRMGLALEGHTFAPNSDGMMKSAPVFPGTIQCPPSGVPIALSCDAQTTGGYPRIAHIARCDRHLLGQARPGDRVRLLRRSMEDARRDEAEKTAFLQTWMKA